MKKLLLTVLVMASTVFVHADEYLYLTFESADGTKTSISSSELVITIHDGKLFAGLQNFNLTDLCKMYFSISDDTSGIEDINDEMADETTDIFDLQGRKVDTEQMKRGIYVIKTKNGSRKVIRNEIRNEKAY